MIEQITYLIFIKRLDEMQELEERKATTLGKPIERRIFPEGNGRAGRALRQNLRWSRFKHFAGARCSASSTSTSSRSSAHSTAKAPPMHATCATPVSKFRGPALLAKVVDKLDKLDMGDRDTKGDVYEYMLAKIASGRPERPVPHAPPHHRD